MKYILINIFFLALYSSSLLSQSSHVLDANIVNERYAINKDFIDIGFDLHDYTTFLLYRDSLTISTQMESKLKSGRFKWNLKPSEIDYCYLFDEQYTWSLRAFRTINLFEKENEFFIKGSRRIMKYKNDDGSLRHDTIFNKKMSLINLISNDLKKGYLTPYQFPFFEYDTTFKKLLNFDSISNTIKYVKIKEDWRYNKRNGKLECHPIGLAFLDENKNELMWFYYAELRFGLIQNYIRYNFKEIYSRPWSTIIEQQLFATESIILEHHKNHQPMEFIKNDYNLHRNDFDPLFQLELINSYVNKNYQNHTGIVNIKNFDGRIITGKLINGIKQGKWTVLFENKKENISISYLNNLPNGNYLEKDKKGTILTNGTFEYGLRTGEWFSFYSNGKTKTRRNYNSGMMIGKQETWYKSGQKHLIYHYKNFKLNGEFKRWNKEGVLTEKGVFKNDYFNGKWDINLKIPKEYIEIIKGNPNHKWGFEISALDDGYLTYSVVLEQINDYKFCTVSTCLKQVSITEIK